MHFKYFVGGVNGVGKTTLLRAIAEASPSFRIVKGSERFMQHLGIPGNYDALRRLPEEVKSREWSNCLEQILDETYDLHQDLLLDAHYLNLIEGQVTTVTGVWMETFDAAVLVTASAEEILGRIQQDLRDRALFYDEADELAILKSYLEATEKEFSRCVKDYGLSGLKLIQGNGGTQEAVQEFLKFDVSLRT